MIYLDCVIENEVLFLWPQPVFVRFKAVLAVDGLHLLVYVCIVLWFIDELHQ